MYTLHHRNNDFAPNKLRIVSRIVAKARRLSLLGVTAGGIIQATRYIHGQPLIVRSTTGNVPCFLSNRMDVCGLSAWSGHALGSEGVAASRENQDNTPQETRTVPPIIASTWPRPISVYEKNALSFLDHFFRVATAIPAHDEGPHHTRNHVPLVLLYKKRSRRTDFFLNTSNNTLDDKDSTSVRLELLLMLKVESPKFRFTGADKTPRARFHRSFPAPLPASSSSV